MKRPSTVEEVHAALEKYGIKSYKINDDLSVDVKGTVVLRDYDRAQFPVQFGLVTGDFVCRHSNELSSLEFGPHTVNGLFDCEDCPKLTSIAKYLPRVKGSLTLSFRYIRHGGLGLFYSGQSFIVNSAGPNFDILPEPFKIISKWLPNVDYLFECQAELIDNGFADFAEI